MPVCAHGHESADEEFCDVCGLAFAGGSPVAVVAEPPPAVGNCPSCGAALGGRFCEDCLEVTRMSPNQVLSVAFLAATVPFEVGDHVECRTAGERYEGTGEIVKVSMDLKDGGTPVIPIFHVVYDRVVTEYPFAAAVGSDVQWIFDRTEPSGVRAQHPRAQYLAVLDTALDDPCALRAVNAEQGYPLRFIMPHTPHLRPAWMIRIPERTLPRGRESGL